MNIPIVVDIGQITLWQFVDCVIVVVFELFGLFLLENYWFLVYF